MRLVYHVMSAPAPLGLLFLAASDRGVRHIEFMDRRSLKRTLAAHAPAGPEMTWEMSLHELRPLADQIDEMLTGTRKSFEWPLDLGEDPFTIALAHALDAVPYGQTTTVAELARTLGRPRDLKAVADAVLRNPLALLVPCHRVVGADGKPSNYVGGAPRKKFLLELEARFSRMGGLDDNRVIGELVRRVPRAVTPARVTRRASAAPRKSASAASTRTSRAKSGAGVVKRKTAPTAARPAARMSAAPARSASPRTAPARPTASSKKRSR